MFDPRPDIACAAAVQRLDMITGGGSWIWRVNVRSAPFWPVLLKRVYFIEAPSDTVAAREGIARFVAEAKTVPGVIAAE